MVQSNKQFFTEYLNNPSPSGFESKGQSIWLKYISSFTDSHIVDSYGSVAAIINPGKEYKVVVAAHADEVSWLVNYIDDEGYIYVRQNGMADFQIAPAKRVNIHTKNGIVKGFFGWPAIHVREEERPTPDNLFIDIGRHSRSEVADLGIYPGIPITFEDSLFELTDDYYVGRGLDNRVGGYILAEVARKINESNLVIPYSLYFVNAVQEEVGMRGAGMMAHGIRPNVALITDVCHDSCSPMYNQMKMGTRKVGRGPVLTSGPSVHNNVLNRVVETANEHQINIQRTSFSHSSGTDTDAFAYSRMGIPSALIGLPVKYMHTTVEMVNKNDVENLIDLIFFFLKDLKFGLDFGYSITLENTPQS